MMKALQYLLKSGRATPPELFPSLPAYSRGLPALTESPCDGCEVCAAACPTSAIAVERAGASARVTLDLGCCITCGQCVDLCPTGTIIENRATATAVSRREALVLRTPHRDPNRAPEKKVIARSMFSRSIHLRAVATGDAAADLEIGAANNPIFDSSRFGIHFVASPRHADALIVTGPAPLAMQDPLRRCYEAMADPRMVIAIGASAVSGGLHRGGYAQANGVDTILPVDVYVPGNPPHPWSILHGILLAMGIRL